MSVSRVHFGMLTSFGKSEQALWRGLGSFRRVLGPFLKAVGGPSGVLEKSWRVP